jgi:hypothetical protein
VEVSACRNEVIAMGPSFCLLCTVSVQCFLCQPTARCKLSGACTVADKMKYSSQPPAGKASLYALDTLTPRPASPFQNSHTPPSAQSGQHLTTRCTCACPHRCAVCAPSPLCARTVRCPSLSTWPPSMTWTPRRCAVLPPVCLVLCAKPSAQSGLSSYTVFVLICKRRRS